MRRGRPGAELRRSRIFTSINSCLPLSEETSSLRPKDPDLKTIVTACDRNTIPVATNIATAEMLVLGLGRGDLDWRIGMRTSDTL